MNETRRMLTLFGVILVVVGLLCLIAFWPEKDKTFKCEVEAEEDYAKVGMVSYENFKCLQKEEEYLIAVSEKITKDDKKALNSVFESAGLGVYAVSLKDYSKEEADKLKTKLEYDKDSFEKSVLIYVKDGEVKEYKENILDDKKAIEKFLEENGLNKFMCGVSEMEDYSNLAEVDYDKFECLKKQDKPFVIVLAQTTCSYCEQFKPVLNDFAKENNTVAYIINIDTLEESEMTKLSSAFSYFEENTEWGTPLTLGVKDGEVVSDLSGYTDQKEQIKALYEEAGILK